MRIELKSWIMKTVPKLRSYTEIMNKEEMITEPSPDQQNETVTGNITISADVIKAGSNVTNIKPTGPVTFNSGEINLNGGIVEIEGETTVTLGTTLNINNQ